LSLFYLQINIQFFSVNRSRNRISKDLFDSIPVNLDYSSSTNPALRTLVLHRLHQVLHIQAQNWCIEAPTRPTVEAIHQFQPQISLLRHIPIKFVKNQTQVSYVSAIALSLEKPWQKPAPKIAQSLVKSLTQLPKEGDFAPQSHPHESIWNCFLFESNSAGLIIFKLSDQGLAKWLQFLMDLTQESGNAPPWRSKSGGNSQNFLRDLTDSSHSIRNCTDLKSLPRNSTDLFQAQHAHARCCSLLRLGMEAKLLQTLSALPWIDSNGLIRCRHASERQLIEQICQIWDRIIFSEPDETIKLIRGLSQSFERFYRDCTIFGEVKMNDPALAQVRLGLVAGVRSLLQLLLESLDIAVPTEF
jgi:DALR anticodon binding domain